MLFFDEKNKKTKTAGVKKKDLQKYMAQTSDVSNNLNNVPPELKNKPPSETRIKPGIL